MMSVSSLRRLAIDVTRHTSHVACLCDRGGEPTGHSMRLDDLDDLHQRHRFRAVLKRRHRVHSTGGVSSHVLRSGRNASFVESVVLHVLGRLHRLTSDMRVPPVFAADSPH